MNDSGSLTLLQQQFQQKEKYSNYYWHHENEDNGNDTKFGKEIEAAIQKL